jgi:hypothetical protein
MLDPRVLAPLSPAVARDFGRLGDRRKGGRATPIFEGKSFTVDGLREKPQEFFRAGNRGDAGRGGAE